MLLKRTAVLLTLGIALGLVSNACGSRTTLLPVELEADAEDRDASVRECNVDLDCGDSENMCGPLLCIDGQCIQRFVVCNDGDPCTIDSCEPETGKCVTAPATLDLDGDGFKGALPGTVPGAPDSCGEDCDDTSPAAHPGAVEVCDSVDNDCNGVVDDGSGYAPPAGGPTDVRISSNLFTSANPGGIAHDGSRYFAVYGGRVQNRERAYGAFLDLEGNRSSDENRLVLAESDIFPAGAVWTGDRYGVIWSDRRVSNYEVFFAMFDRDGKKMAPGDIRLSATDAFSINIDLAWTGTEFVAVWQDGDGDNGSFRVVGRRIGLDGVPLGEAVTLSSNGESPRLAVGRPGIGVVYTSSGSQTVKDIFFQPVDFALAPLGPSKQIEPPVPGVYPSVRWNDDEFVVVWDARAAPFQLYGTSLDGLGNTRVAPRALTDSPRNARYGAMIPLGDRLVMVYADGRDGGNYEIYSQTYRKDLEPQGLPTRITNSDGNSITPRPLLGPQGDIGVLFADQRQGEAQTYFTRLVCETAPQP